MAPHQKTSRQTTEQTVNVSGKIKPAVTKYYLKISGRYRLWQIALILLLLVYIFFIVNAFGKYITYDNMQYLLRDFDSMSRTGESEFSRIRYDRQSEQTFTVFKNGIAQAGKESMELFDSTGLLLCSDRTNFNDPVLVPSEKYLLLYDMGGTGYSVYNAITRVISRTEEYRIADGDMSDTGAFILVTRSGETKYMVKHYNSALTHTMNIYKDNFVMDAAISRNGRQIVVASAVPSATDFDCEIALYNVGETEMQKKILLPHTMPMSVYFGEDGFTVLCDNKLCFYNKEGEELAVHTLSGMTLEYADLTQNGTVLAASENALGSENRIMVFSPEGELLANDMLRERVMGVGVPSLKDDNAVAYILTPEKVLRLTPAETEEKDDDSATPKYGGFAVEEEHVGAEDVLAIRPAGRGVIVCTATGAYYLFS